LKQLSTVSSEEAAELKQLALRLWNVGVQMTQKKPNLLENNVKRNLR
jgi:hypothetical protein